VINRNASRATHIVAQRGLWLVDAGDHSTLMGRIITPDKEPSIPNNVVRVEIYPTKIQEVCNRENLVFADKLAETVAHELFHANNVCHHGLGDQTPNGFDFPNGLRSGVINCIMRYDNRGRRVPGQAVPEPIPNALCNSPTGDGYNAPNGGGFGNAAPGRGNCIEQIRVSGRERDPKDCGDR
jgi:hypothetical protein